MKSRLVANFVALCFVGAGFYVVTAVINLMAATEEIEQHEFSYLKRTADQHWSDKNWQEAARYYREVAESDPLNAGAQLAYAWNLKMQILGDIRKARAQDQSELGPETEALIREAIDAFETSLESTQFRNIARVQLGFHYNLLGEREKAIPYVIEALEDGYQVKLMRNEYAQDSLLNDPRVKAVVEKIYGKRK